MFEGSLWNDVSEFSRGISLFHRFRVAGKRGKNGKIFVQWRERMLTEQFFETTDTVSKVNRTWSCRLNKATTNYPSRFHDIW